MNIQQIRNFANTHTGGMLLGQDGELKKATTGDHLRSFFNIGDARTRNRDLLDTVRAAIRADSKYFGFREEALRLVDGIGTMCVVKGKDLQRLFAALDRVKSWQKLDDLIALHIAMRGGGA